jgi:GAF domain-containing protein
MLEETVVPKEAILVGNGVIQGAGRVTPAEAAPGRPHALAADLVELAAAPELTPAFQAACRAAVGLGFDHAALVVVETGGAEGWVGAEHPGRGMVGRRLALREVPALRDLTTLRRPVAVPDLAAVDCPPLHAWLEGSGARSLLAVPVARGERMLGWLSLHPGRPGASEASPEAEGAGLVAAQLALVAEHLRVASSAAEGQAEIDSVRRASAAIAALMQDEGGEDASLLDRIVQTAVRSLDAAGGGVYRYTPASGELALLTPRTDPEAPRVQRIDESLPGRVVRSGAPLHVSAGGAGGEGGWLGVPLRWSQRVTGVLYVRGGAGRELTGADAEPLAEAAAQASLALAHRRRGDETAAEGVPHDRRGTGAHQAAVSILGDVGVKPLDERLHEIARQAAEVLGCEGCQVLLARPEGWLTLKARHPGGGHGAAVGATFEIRSGPHTGLTGHVAHTRRVFRAHGRELLHHPAVRRLEDDRADGPACHSLMAFPLLVREDGADGRLVGLLRLENKRDGSGAASPEVGFSADDQKNGEIFGEALATVIAREELLQAIRRQNEALASQCSTLAQVIELQGAPLWQTTQEALLREVALRATLVTGYACAVVYAVNAERGEATVVVTHGVAAQEGGGRERLDGSFVGRVVGKGCIQVLHGTPAPGDGLTLGGVEFDAVIGVPLHGADRSVQWVLLVADRSDSQALSQEACGNLQTFADYVGRLVQISRLWTFEERSLRQSESVRRLVAFMRGTRERERLLGALLTGLTAGYGLGYNRAAIFLLDAGGGHLECAYAVGSVTRTEAHDAWEAEEKSPTGVDLVLKQLEQGPLDPTDLDVRIRGVRIAAPDSMPAWVAPALARGYAVAQPETVQGEWPPQIAQAFKPHWPLLLVPILRGEQLGGFVVADNAFVPRPVDEMAAEAVSLVAEGVGALRALDQGEAHSLGGGGDDLREVHAQIVKYALHEIFGGNRAGLWSYDPTLDAFALRHYEGPGLPRELRDRDPQEGKVLRLAQEAEWTGVGDVEGAPPEVVPTATRAMLLSLGVRSFQACALSFAGQPLGVICVGSPTPREFVEERDRTLAVAFGRRAALALRQAQLVARIRRAHKAAGGLAHVGTALEPGDELPAMARTALEALECHAVIVYEYEHATGTLLTPPAVAVHEGAEETLLKALDGEAGQWLAWHALDCTEPWLVEDSTRDETFARASLAEMGGVRGCVIVPLRAGDVNVGVLCVAHDRPYRFTQEERDDIQLFANQMALAIHSRQLYRDVQSAAPLVGLGMVDQNWSHNVADYALIVEENAQFAADALAKGMEDGEITPDLEARLRTCIGELAGVAPHLREPPIKERFGENVVEVPVNDFLRALMEARQTRYNVEFRLELEASEQDRVRVNRNWLVQACDALLHNAEKAMRGSPHPPRITLASRRRGLRVILECADSGPGMPEAVRRRAGKVPSTPSTSGGMGVGLILVQSIAMQYGGHLVAPEPPPGGGAVLQVSLPLAFPRRQAPVRGETLAGA